MGGRGLEIGGQGWGGGGTGDRGRRPGLGKEGYKEVDRAAGEEMGCAGGARV